MADLTGALTIIKTFEKFMPKAYLCPAGIQTIGYKSIGPNIRLGMVWTEREATEDLKINVDSMFHAVSDLLNCDYDDNEICSIISFAYSVGFFVFRSSSLLKALNNRSLSKCEAAKEMLKFDYHLGRHRNSVKALRIAEFILFTEGRFVSLAESLDLIPSYYKGNVPILS